MDIEAKLEGKRVYGNALDHFERVAYGMANFFEARVEDYILHLKRRPKAISQHLNRAGKVILLSSRDMAWDEVLSLYRERDVVEKLYDDLKTTWTSCRSGCAATNPSGACWSSTSWRWWCARCC